MRRTSAIHWLGAVLLGLVALRSAAAAAPATDEFARANQEFAEGHFRAAIDLYSAHVERGERNAVLFYNLGNACYKEGDFGRAILNYERALQLEPHHPEAEANLRLVRDKARALELRRNWLERALERATSNQYTVAAAASFWLALFALAALLFARRRSGGLVFGLLFASAVFAFAVYALYVRENGAKGRALAVVTAKTTEARLATADSAGTVLTLPPGSEVKILSTRGDWTYVALPNEQRGWIPAANAERVRL